LNIVVVFIYSIKQYTFVPSQSGHSTYRGSEKSCHPAIF
jgi:hypothetical protein